MKEGEIYEKAKGYFESESFPLPKSVFREFYSQLIKLSGFGLGGIFVLSGKKAGARAAVYLKKLVGENLTQDDTKTCIIAALQAYNQKVIEFNLEDNFALIKIDNSIFADGITSKKPVCLPLGGSLAGMMETFMGGSFEPKEIECKACGGQYCVFEIKRKS
ncbi:MAG: 4-vinyl reductase [Desulfurella sp.]|jgi:predicted hydrocarbon binding protein|uniref:4-vinyl reductase n=1 Tax=Desulfurella sp. TaxID=1962857 RepID=UPI000CBDD18B|nr:4-vinyl reductase [Desulfurella sp.]PMP87608.1 MAG: 4-vinyl reductase [Desulfurella sp.]HEX14073.1 4-vinyl reductase [Desulfurella acetivorans]